MKETDCMGKTGIIFASVVFSLVLLSGIITSSYSDYLSPKKQLESGVLPENVLCRENRVLVIRDNGSPACVSEKTAEKKGWMIIVVDRPTDKTVPDPENPKFLDDAPSIQENVKINNESTGVTKSHVGDVSKTVTENIHLQEPPKQSTDADDPCHGAAVVAGHPYVLVEPITHSMTGGTFEKLCAQPHYKWFKIYLNTDAGGSITLEIPKSVVDLKQYDYLDCNAGGYYLDGKYDGYTLKNFTVEHLAQTDKSRTLKFTYDKPVSVISYFGAYGVFDGVDSSEPKFCINAYEQNNYDPTKRLPWNDPPDEPTICYRLLDLNYTITNGSVDKICGGNSINNEDIRVDFHLSGIMSGAELTVDIPWSDMRPYHVRDMGREKFDGDTSAGTPECNPPRELLFRNQDYQTFKIPLLENATSFVIGFSDVSMALTKFSEIIAAVEPFDRSKDVFTEKCD